MPPTETFLYCTTLYLPLDNVWTRKPKPNLHRPPLWPHSLCHSTQGLQPVTTASCATTHCGTSVAANPPRKMRDGIQRSTVPSVGAPCQTCKFRWHQLVRFNYPLILFALNKAHANPGANGRLKTTRFRLVGIIKRRINDGKSTQEGGGFYYLSVSTETQWFWAQIKRTCM